MAQMETAELYRVIDHIAIGERGQPPHRHQRQAPLKIRRILLAVEPIHASNHALAWATDLGRRFHASVSVISVASGRHGLGPYAKVAQRKAVREDDLAQRVVADCVKILSHADIRHDGHVASGSPVAEIVRMADRGKADLVVMGSHGWGRPRRILLGSVVDGVKNQVGCSVLIAKQPPPASHILAGIDGSPQSRRGAGFALRLAHDGTDVTLFHAVTVSPYASDRGARRAFEESVRALDLIHWARPGVHLDVRYGRPADAILRRANALGSNLVVVGSRGLGGPRSLMAGTVSSPVSHRARQSVLMVK